MPGEKIEKEIDRPFGLFWSLPEESYTLSPPRAPSWLVSSCLSRTVQRSLELTRWILISEGCHRPHFVWWFYQSKSSCSASCFLLMARWKFPFRLGIDLFKHSVTLNWNWEHFKVQRCFITTKCLQQVRTRFYQSLKQHREKKDTKMVGCLLNIVVAFWTPQVKGDRRPFFSANRRYVVDCGWLDGFCLLGWYPLGLPLLSSQGL